MTTLTLRLQLAEVMRDWATWDAQHPGSGIGYAGAKSSTPSLKTPGTPKISSSGKSRSAIMQSLGSTVDQIVKEHHGSAAALATKIENAKASARQQLAKSAGASKAKSTGTKSTAKGSSKSRTGSTSAKKSSGSKARSSGTKAKSTGTKSKASAGSKSHRPSSMEALKALAELGKTAAETVSGRMQRMAIPDEERMFQDMLHERIAVLRHRVMSLEVRR